MQYRLRTLLIVLAVAPPLVAPLIWLLWENPAISMWLFIALVFSVFWLSCGLIWHKIVELFEYCLQEPRK
jgi:hypothetical protein